MRLVKTVVILFVLAAASVPAVAQDTAPTGMVLQTTGAAEVERGGSRNPVRLADLLFPGDRIITTAGTVSFVFCPDESMVNVGANATIALNDSDIEVVSGDAPTRGPSRCVLPQVALGSESMERVGALRGRGYPPVELYLGGKISQGRPVFIWGGIDGAASYHLTLTTISGGFVWETDTTELEAAYPETMPPLNEGEMYRWELSASDGANIVGQQSATLRFEADASLDALAGADDLVRAIALENGEYFAEAAQLYRQFRDAEGDRIGQRLAWLYWNSGLIAAANAELDQLP